MFKMKGGIKQRSNESSSKMLKGMCCHSRVMNKEQRKSTGGFEPFMVTKFNKIVSRDSNQSTCQRPTPFPSSVLSRVLFKSTVQNQ